MSEVLDSKTLKALSSETRQEIIKYLSKRPYTASELSKITKKHVTTITEHLDTLEKSGLVQKKEDATAALSIKLTPHINLIGFVK